MWFYVLYFISFNQSISFVITAKLKNAKVQFDDESRYNRIASKIDYGQDPILKTAALAAGLYDDLTIELGKWCIFFSIIKNYISGSVSVSVLV